MKEHRAKKRTAFPYFSKPYARHPDKDAANESNSEQPKRNSLHLIYTAMKITNQFYN